MIFKNINSEDISGLIICSEPPISSSAIRTKETTIDGRDGAIVEKLGYKTRIRNVEIGLKKDANVDKILSYFSGEGDLIFKNENDKVYKAAIYEQVDLERLLRLRKGSVAFYCQPFKYKRNDIFETIKDNKVKEKKGKHLELLNCAEQNVVDLKLGGSTNQATRSGKNLLKLTTGTLTANGVTITVAEDGLITLNGTITNNNTIYPIVKLTNGLENSNNVASIPASWLNQNTGIKGTYTLEKIYVSGSTTYSGAPAPSTYSADGVRVDFIITRESGVSNTTVETDLAFVAIYLTTNGTEFTNYKFYLQVEEGTKSEVTEYEQYGASPSPDYPSEIENVEGKNIFDNKHPTAISQGAIWQPTETGGKYSTTVNWKKIEWRFKLDTSKTYTFHYKARNSSTLYLYIKTFTDNTYSTEKTSIIADGTATSKTFTPDTQYVLIKFDNSAVEADVLIEELQLEEGTVATDYVPYNSLEIKDVGENLFNPSNAKDGYVSDGSGQIIGVNIKNKNTGYIKIDGEEKYFILSNKLTGNWGAWYDKDKKFISGITLGSKNKGIVTAPNNAYFINFTVSYENNNPDYANNVMIARSDKEIPYKPYQEQKVDFPLSEGQKLYEGSYLASDGIHYKRKQVVLNGTENVSFYPNMTHTFRISIRPLSSSGICTHYKQIKSTLFNTETGMFLVNSNSFIVSDPRFSTTEEFKAYLAQQYSAGTPVTFEYIMIESNLITSHEEIVPYTTEQQEAYNQLQKLKLYKGQNTMFSLEGSIINLKYLEDTDEKVENQGNIYSKPIIRLEKTVFKEVEIAINGIRFKYNFEEDDYVEIDCEEMTVQYEGLDRNRRLVIDFEFPKLKEGNNDIVMYSGDCIIKCKRKDRWL